MLEFEAASMDYERLVQDHARLMAFAIRKVCGSRHNDLVPDVEQEVRLALWKRLRDGNDIQHPTSYIYKVAVTTALSVVRKMGMTDVRFEDTDFRREATPSPVAGSLEPVERAALLREALEALEPDESRAVRAYLAGFNHREVAKLYGWTESVARHRIYRSIEALSRRLNAHRVS